MRFLRPSIVGAAVAVVALSGAGLASAQTPALPNVVSEIPATYTPQVTIDANDPHPAVYAIDQGGSTMYAGGSFQTIIDDNGNSLPRSNLFAFDATSGAVSSGFTPSVNGDVWAIQPSGDNVYVGGFFKSINGVARHGIAELDATTGAVVTAFKSTAVGGPVTEIRLVDNRLIVSGNFPGKILALDPTTGADTGYIHQAVAGTLASNAGATRVYRFAVDPAGTRLVGIGNFTSVGGQHRDRAFMLDLGSTSATVDPWYYQPLDNPCTAVRIPAQVRDVDFSSDGSFFVFFASGFVPTTPAGIGRDLCDSASRFETNTPNPTRPTWINYTGGDTMWSGAVTGNTVYAQGHFRWLDNPGGKNSCGPGCAPRQGIGAIDATTGKALAWNPGKTRAVGGKDLLVTPAGLWVASDGRMFDGKVRYGLAFCPES